MQYQGIVELIERAGFVARGGFCPDPSDEVPEVMENRPAATIILVGNAGGSMWKAFTRERDPLSDSLDEWTKENLDSAARKIGAKALYPFTRPYLPFLRWARKAEACHTSPLGIAIHPDYGLWHAFRGALAIADRIALPPPDKRASPCASCPDKPCLTACPVGAFQAQDYDVPACVHHLASRKGQDCMNGGCLARHACPIGREFVYSGEQAKFLMSAFLANNER